MNVFTTAAARATRGPRAAMAMVALGLAGMAAGCATQQLDAQWSNPQQAPASLRGEKVMVVCDAAEPVVRQICQDKLAAEVAASGAQAVSASVPVDGSQAGDATARQAAQARALGARAVLSVSITPDVSQATQSGMSVGFGLGGFGFGRGGFGGVGVSAPIGGDIRIQSGYAGNASLIEAKAGALLWTAKTRSNPQDNIDEQMSYIARAVAEGARKSGRL